MAKSGVTLSLLWNEYCVACLRLDKFKGTTYISMFDFFRARNEAATKFKNGEITEDEYNQWRYKYPEFDTYQRRAKTPSQELGDSIIDALNKKK